MIMASGCRFLGPHNYAEAVSQIEKGRWYVDIPSPSHWNLEVCLVDHKPLVDKRLHNWLHTDYVAPHHHGLGQVKDATARPQTSVEGWISRCANPAEKALDTQGMF